MNRFGDKGGRRTIGGRQIALEQWQANAEEGKSNSVLLTVRPEEMDDMARYAPNGGIWISKSQESNFFKNQRKGETNGQTLARLLRKNIWNVSKYF